MNYDEYFNFSNNNVYTSKMYVPYKTLEHSLNLIQEALKDELKEETLSSYLITQAPTEEERNIIARIRDDEKRHALSLVEIYKFYKGEKIPAPEVTTFKLPKSYIDGIQRARSDELEALQKYRDIRAGMPDRFFRDMMLELITDEIIHTFQYNFILISNLEEKTNNNNIDMKDTPTFTRQGHFTENDAYLIAKVLGVDFNNERFDIEQFRMGLDVELEHGNTNELTNITNNDSIRTGKIVLVHLRKFPDYYTRLKKMEEEAKAHWSLDDEKLF